jgi:hypothetical protein
MEVLPADHNEENLGNNCALALPTLIKSSSFLAANKIFIISVTLSIELTEIA